MEEKIQFVADDEVVDEIDVSDNSTDDISEAEADNGMGAKLLAGGAAAVGVAATLAWKKFGPGIKAKAKEFNIKRLTKKNEKLAAKQMAVQTKLNQMAKPDTETGKEK